MTRTCLNAPLKKLSNRDIWEEYKEKIIDFKFDFSPSEEENLNEFLLSFKNSHPIERLDPEILKETAKKYRCDNMRTIRRAFFKTIRYRFIEDWFLGTKTENKVYHSVFAFSISHDSQEMDGRTSPIIKPLAPWESLVKEGVVTGIIEKNMLKETLKNYENEKMANVPFLQSLVHKHISTAHNDKDDFVKELKEFFEEENISLSDMGGTIYYIQTLAPDMNLTFYLKKFKERVKKFALEALEGGDYGLLSLRPLTYSLAGDERIKNAINQAKKEATKAFAEHSSSSNADLLNVISRIVSDGARNEIDEEIAGDITPDQWNELIECGELKLPDLANLYWKCPAAKQNIDKMIQNITQMDEYMKFKFKHNGLIG